MILTFHTRRQEKHKKNKNTQANLFTTLAHVYRHNTAELAVMHYG